MSHKRIPEELLTLAKWRAAVLAGPPAPDLLAVARAGWEVSPHVNLEEAFADGWYQTVDDAAAVLGISHEELEQRIGSEKDPQLKPLVDNALREILDGKWLRSGKAELEAYLAKLEKSKQAYEQEEQEKARRQSEREEQEKQERFRKFHSKTWVTNSCRFATLARRGWALLNCRLASDYHEMLREKVETLSEQNPYPFSRWFGGQNKVFIPFAPGPTDDVASQEPDKDVQDLLREEGFEIVDYRGGYCQKGTRKQRIGKVIQQLKKNALEEIKAKGEKGEIYNLQRELEETSKYYDSVLGQFLNSPLRAQKKAGGMEIVISQDPHDVATMSTGRSWTSCMELGEGSHYEDVFCEVAGGGLVAYLIRAGDRGISDPLARIHIRRFDNKRGQSVAVPEQSVYGNEVSGFQETVRMWLDSMQPDIKPGVYERMGGAYSDTFGRETVIGPKKPEDVVRWFRGQDPDAVYSKFTVHDELYEELEADEETQAYDPLEERGIWNMARTFNSREDAEAYLKEAREEESETERGMASDEWAEFDEDAGDWAKDRFRITEKAFDHRRDMKNDAAGKIIKAKQGTYPEDILREVMDYVLESGSQDLVRTFVRKYPEMIDPERAKLLKDSDSIEFVKALPEEKRGPYLRSWLGHVNDAIDDPSSLMDDKAKQSLQEAKELETKGEGVRAPFPGGPSVVRNLKSRAVNDIQMKLHDWILEPLRELFSPIPEDVSRKLVDLFSNLEEKTGVPLREFREDEDRFLSDLAHAFHMTKTDTPTVQNFYESLLPRWVDRMPGDKWGRPGPISLDTLGPAIASLGMNGRRFLPFLNQKLEQEKGVLEQHKNPEKEWPLLRQREESIRNSEKNIEKFLYVIDAISNGTGRSSKYRFF